ncbi:hypothetical protein EJB05_12772, partial [Eragrostis curvula]
MNTKVFIQLLVYASVFALFTVPQALGEKECYGEKVTFLQKCSRSIQRGYAYVHPSSSCCEAVQEIDMTCVCGIITRLDKINAQNAYRVSLDCNNPVPAGNRCGGWTIPAGPPPPNNLQL